MHALPGRRPSSPRAKSSTRAKHRSLTPTLTPTLTLTLTPTPTPTLTLTLTLTQTQTQTQTLTQTLTLTLTLTLTQDASDKAALDETVKQLKAVYQSCEQLAEVYEMPLRVRVAVVPLLDDEHLLVTDPALVALATSIKYALPCCPPAPPAPVTQQVCGVPAQGLARFRRDAGEAARLRHRGGQGFRQPEGRQRPSPANGAAYLARRHARRHTRRHARRRRPRRRRPNHGGRSRSRQFARRARQLPAHGCSYGRGRWRHPGPDACWQAL